MKIQPEWIEWAKGQIRMLKDGAHMIIPNCAVFKLDKNNKTLITMAEAPDFYQSSTQKINEEVFGVIGWKIIRDESKISKNIKAFMDKVLAKGGKMLAEVPGTGGMGAVFQLPAKDGYAQMKQQMNGNAEPVNPITLYGKPKENPNLSIGRLWLQSNEITFGQHSFSSKEKRENQEKTMQFVFWEDMARPMGFMLIPNEAKFIEGIWLLKDGNKPSGFTLSGIRSKKEPNPSQITFSRSGDKLTVSMDNIKAEYDWDHVYRGLKHLFPKAELINPAAN